MVPASGKLIFLNGASSAGKSTLCRALQAELPEPFVYFALDLLLFSKEVIPRRPGVAAFEWALQRPRLFDGYRRCLPAMLAAGNNLLADYVLETEHDLTELIRVLRGFDVFFVGVHCPLPELERRERARGDRRIGDARTDVERVHTFSQYDFEVDSSRPAPENAVLIVRAWQQRQHPGVFEQLVREP